MSQVVCLWVCFGPGAGAPGPCGVLRWCPTLPHPGGCSTIGAVGLSFRVRDGSGRFPHAVTTAGWSTCVTPGGVWGGGLVVNLCSGCERVLCVPLVCWGCFVFSVGQLVPVSLGAHCWASTSGLSTQCSSGVLHTRGCWKPHLEVSFPLRCFQRLSCPNVANQPCTWRYNWHTRGSSVPVLSY